MYATRMFQKATKEDYVDLTGLTQGKRYALTVTNVKCDVRLQFMHLGDPTWYDFPDFDGTHGSFPPTGAASDVIVGNFLCNSPVFRLSLVTDGAHAGEEDPPWYVSVVPYTIAEY